MPSLATNGRRHSYHQPHQCVEIWRGHFLSLVMHSFHLLTYHAKRFCLVLVQKSRLLARSGNECFVSLMDGKVNKERRACQLLLFASGFQNVLKIHIVPNTKSPPLLEFRIISKLHSERSIVGLMSTRHINRAAGTGFLLDGSGMVTCCVFVK